LDFSKQESRTCQNESLLASEAGEVRCPKEGIAGLMTYEAILTVARGCLVEYETRLKVLGPPHPYRNGAVMVKRTFNDPLHILDERRIRFEIAKILDHLAGIEQGFTMSEPDLFPEGVGYIVHTVRHENLNLSVIGMYDASTLDTFTHIVCWYYPARNSE
jgi:hypothetical protein